MWQAAPITSLAELAALVRVHPELHVRFSAGPASDAACTSRDGGSGVDLPGLSTNPLAPEPWWTRPAEDWLARQLCQYRQLAEGDEQRYAWLLTGALAGRGPDCEPLLAEVEPVARIAEAVLDEARRRYEERFNVGSTPG